MHTENALAIESSTTGRALARPKLLLVDDDPLLLRALIWCFRPNFEVHTAENALRALALLSEDTYEIVISDYIMPGHHGLWLLDEIRRLYPEILRVLHSGSSPPNLDEHMRDGLVELFIAKPMMPDATGLLFSMLRA
jgi:two-component system, NtrC family, response regulator HupR/HoxA